MTRRSRLVALRFGAALLALGAGVSVYLFGRPAGSSYLGSYLDALHWDVGLFGAVGSSLPSFAHAFGFSLLSSLMVRRRWAACGLWALLGALFELTQQRAVAAYLAELPLPSVVQAYARGHFDPWDIGASCLGAACAYLYLRLEA